MLQEIQKQIEETYEVRCPVKVEEYLLDEHCKGPLFLKMPKLAQSMEALLVEQSGEEIHVGLWLEPRLLAWALRQKWGEWRNTEIIAVAPLVEGVSHFVYLLWRAEREERVTQLELELQAEVDKFILLTRGGAPEHATRLMESLFSEVRWRPSLGLEERNRYETALRLASRYCHQLRTIDWKGRTEEFFHEIRSFYRMNQPEKIRRITA